MTTSQMEFLSEILDGENIPDSAFVYFRGRLLNRVHSLLLQAYRKRCNERGLKQKDLARLIHRSTAVINRHIGLPGNWTLNTVADLLLGLRAELDVNLVFLEDLMERPPAALDLLGAPGEARPSEIGGLNGSRFHSATLGEPSQQAIITHNMQHQSLGNG